MNNLCFVDDVLIVNKAKSVREIQTNLKKCMSIALKWYKLNRLKLNMDKFNKCMLSKASVSKIDFSMKEAKRIGVEGTPVIYINGMRVLNHSLDGLVEVIEKVLSNGICLKFNFFG